VSIEKTRKQNKNVYFGCCLIFVFLGYFLFSQSSAGKEEQKRTSIQDLQPPLDWKKIVDQEDLIQ
jgi:hypothetical protein